MKFNRMDRQLLDTINSIKDVPDGAVNIRRDGEVLVQKSSSNISIIPKSNKPGFDLNIKPHTLNETVHIPVILTRSGLQDKVYNTFVVGEESDITIIAGCGIHNDSHSNSSHEGIHRIIVKKGARMKYIEKHYGEGKGRKILNPATVLILEGGASAEMEMYQIKGVDDTVRNTTAYVYDNSNVKIIERLLTHGSQSAKSAIKVFIEGEGGSGQILSRSVAQDNSSQIFQASLIGKTSCVGHVECDSIIMGDAFIKSTPELIAESSDAVLTHEAAIGKIAGEQLIKLMSLGLTEKQAINMILEGFLK